MDILIKAGQLLLSLTILVTLHELGHFIPARLFGTRVKKFYLFFDFLFPLPNVLNFSLFKIKRGETEYGIGWFPMGGYVQIDGMVDESMDTEALKEEPKPWEFRSKPAWQRLIIMLGGVTVNLILGFLIYSMVLFTWGKEKLPLANMDYGVYADSTLHKYGIADGDKILGLNDTSVHYFEQLGKAVLIHGARTIEIEHNGKKEMVALPADIEKELLGNGTKSLFMPRYPFEVDSVLPGDLAMQAGFKKGDRIIRVDTTSTPGFFEGLKAIKANTGKEINVVVLRDGEEKTLTTKVSDEGRIGIQLCMVNDFLKTETYRYTFFESIPAGFVETGNVLNGYVSSLKLLFSKEGASQIGGFGSIGSMFPSTWDWHSFWSMTAFLSLVLAIMNVLPIPALDGGHVVFLLYEMVVGKKPSDKFMEYTQTVGMILLLTLLLLANGNDIYKFFLK
ncbi:MAG: RIP metalloprotease RseP [Flavobacteriales bacterium]|nr:RIP metalloprotease RseP [Flavobacteriales bacterium]